MCVMLLTHLNVRDVNTPECVCDVVNTPECVMMLTHLNVCDVVNAPECV